MPLASLVTPDAGKFRYGAISDKHCRSRPCCGRPRRLCSPGAASAIGIRVGRLRRTTPAYVAALNMNWVAAGNAFQSQPTAPPPWVLCFIGGAATDVAAIHQAAEFYRRADATRTRTISLGRRLPGTTGVILRHTAHRMALVRCRRARFHCRIQSTAAGRSALVPQDPLTSRLLIGWLRMGAIKARHSRDVGDGARPRFVELDPGGRSLVG
jgi:hypothetical protein